MRALLLNNYQDATFELTTLPRPQPGPGQVLVRVHASGLNPIDYKIRKGLAPYAMPSLPAILGADAAGEVVALGGGANRFKIGDAVYGMVGGVRGMPGSLADFVAVDEALLAHKPATLSMREAAALPLVSITAWEGLVEGVQLQPGQSVLVQGGAGGVGHIAVQLATALGAKVYATASSSKQALLRELGAVPIDYKGSTVTDYVQQHTGGRGFDVVYDTVGGSSLDDAFTAIRQYGRIASCAAFGTHSLAPFGLHSATLTGVYVLHPMISGEGRARQGEILRRVGELVDQGKIRPQVDKQRFTLATAMQAHAALESHAVTGKVVIDVI